VLVQEFKSTHCWKQKGDNSAKDSFKAVMANILQLNFFYILKKVLAENDFGSVFIAQRG
jgi:hypothetical protein